jgi:hypothetical protein
VSATAQLGWKAAKALKAITATAIFLSRLLARIFMALHPSKRAVDEDVGSKGG